MIKILKNSTSNEIFISDIGTTILANDLIIIDPTQYSALSASTQVIPYIQSGDIIVNNGEYDLPPEVGIIHVDGGVRKITQEVAMMPGIGFNAPAIVELSEAVIAMSMDIGDHFYAHFKMSNLVGNSVTFRWHGTAANSVDDVWAQVNMYFLTSTGNYDKDLTQYDNMISIGPFELLPPIPNIIGFIESEIPSSYFSNKEDLIFIGVKRVATTEKTNWTGPLYTVKHCVEYWQKVM
jgi:hypothetical protein